MHEKSVTRSLKTVWTLLFSLVWIVPLVWVVVRSFEPDGGGGYSLANFSSAWDAAPFPIYYMNTIEIAVCVLAVQLITSTFAAYAFARFEFPFRNALFMVYLVQIMVPPEVLIFPNFSTIGDLGLVDTKLAIMLPYFFSAFGVFLLRQAFKGIPIELEEAARISGCNTLQVIWHIDVPLAIPTFVAFGLVSVTRQWSNFLWPLVVTNSDDNRPLSLGMSMFAKTTESSAQWGTLSAATLLVIAPVLIVFVIFQRQFVSSFMNSGVK